MIYYYDLINYNKGLPEKLKFIDPFDNTVYLTQKDETLKAFIERINIERVNKNLAQLDLDSDLTTSLVIASLAESANKAQLEIYFTKKSVPPSLGQIKSLAKALAYEVMHESSVSLLQTKERAAKCLICPFHASPKSTSPYVSAPFSKLLGQITNKVTSKATKDINFEDLDKVGTCKLCGCPLKSKVRYQLLGILSGLTPEQLETAIKMLGNKVFDICWIFGESATLKPSPAKTTLVKKLQNTSNASKNVVLLELYIEKKRTM